MKKIEIPLLSYGIWRHLQQWRSFFDDEKVSIGVSSGNSAILGWGRKQSGERACKIVQNQAQKSLLLIEDGFLRSMDLGVNGDEALSLSVDDLGIYYDTTKPRRLEALIFDSESLSPALADGAKALSRVVENRLTKYNYVAEGWPNHLVQDLAKKQVLIIDQTFGDLSLKFGGATPATFEEMLIAARAENPDAEIWLKVHPDVLAGKKQGHFSDLVIKMEASPAEYAGIHFLAEDIHPHSLLEKMDKVYVATSQMGFEALMLGKETVVFGVPWYAGWGLTDDRNAFVKMPGFLARRRHATLLELFTAGYLQYCRYINPFTMQRGTIFDVIDYLVMMKRREKLLKGDIWVVGLSFWKRKTMAPFLKTTRNRLRFFKREAALQSAYWQLPVVERANVRLLIWGKKFPVLSDWAKVESISLLRMEDGFIRSVGLGSNLVAPKSLVIDDLGIYFDAGQPSRLERILEETDFSEALLESAKSLQTSLINAGIGKYNVGKSDVVLGELALDRRVLLVPGQVEDDASIKTGTRDIHTNLGLLKRVRAENPEAYIIYKPHPDVVSGNRVGHIEEDIVLQYADTLMPEADILTLMLQCDELHTMTSLSGFEALIRGKKVFCYGLPFYAGWGLTTDLYHLEGRRGRKLTLEALIAGTLLIYPTYLNTETGKLTNAENTLVQLAKERQAQNGKSGITSHWPKRKWQQVKGLYRALRW